MISLGNNHSSSAAIPSTDKSNKVIKIYHKMEGAESTDPLKCDEDGIDSDGVPKCLRVVAFLGLSICCCSSDEVMGVVIYYGLVAAGNSGLLT